MPTYVDVNKCKGNGKCQEICPSDIMFLNRTTEKAFNLEPDMCWECLSCVKTCPEHAIGVRPYADISPLLSEMLVTRDESTRVIKWEIKYRNQVTQKKFEFVIRTTPFDSINISDMAPPDGAAIDTELLAGEESISTIPHAGITDSRSAEPGKGV